VALASANAADMYRAPEGVGGYKDIPYAGVNWSGLYVGVNGGYGWNGDTNGNLVDPSGGFGGGQIGYNFQRGNIVFGLEADFQGADIQDSANLGKDGTINSKMDWFGTVRGRLGYAFDRALIYATGGFAYGDVTTSGTFFLPGPLSISETQTGWVVGAGLEYKVLPNWSVKGEYQYIDLDASSLSGAGPLAVSNSNSTEVHTFRVGLNYFVGGVYEPLK
jgi:outer membrane immunogenic protein